MFRLERRDETGTNHEDLTWVFSPIMVYSTADTDIFIHDSLILQITVVLWLLSTPKLCNGIRRYKTKWEDDTV